MLVRRLTLFDVVPDFRLPQPRITEIQKLLSKGGSPAVSTQDILDTLRNTNAHVYAIRTTKEQIIAIGALYLTETLSGVGGEIRDVAIHDDWQEGPRERLLSRLIDALYLSAIKNGVTLARLDSGVLVPDPKIFKHLL